MLTLWTQRYAQRTERMHRSALDELLRPRWSHLRSSRLLVACLPQTCCP